MGIPSFELYGDLAPADLRPDVLHCESIAVRSRLHDWSFVAHSHPALHQFFWITKGGGRLTLDGVPQGFGQHTLMFMPRLCVHGFAFTPGTSGWVVTVPATLPLPVPETPQVLKVPGPSEPGVLTALFSTIAEEHRQSRPARATVLTAQVMMIAVWTARAAEAREIPKESARRRLMRRFTGLVEAQFRTTWGVERYADALAVTPTHLTRVCRAVTGKPASTVIHERVMLEARRQLAYTTLRIGEVAAELGFSDPAYFTRVFTAHAGLSPRAFRAAAEDRSRPVPAPPRSRQTAGSVQT